MSNLKIIIFILFFSKINSVYSQWSDVSMGTNSMVNVLYVDSASDLLFVGGQFTLAGGANINSIATWDGSNWNSFGNNVGFSSPGAVAAIVNYNGSIFIGGNFDSIGGTLVNNIAKWNGVTWEAVGNGFDDPVRDLRVYKNELYAAGSFSWSGADTVECFAKWNGTNWVRVSILIGSGSSLVEYKNKLIIGGVFFHPEYSSFNSIMGWDGSDIDTTFGVFNSPIIRLKTFSDTLYAVGQFTSNISNPSEYVSVFYDQSWHSIGSPTGGQNWITDILSYHNKLYMCGYFTTPPDLCSYNGLGFDSVADVLGFLKVLTEYKGNMYAGGLFSTLNGMPINNIAQFNSQGIGVAEISDNNKLIIYPTPNSDGKFHIKLFESFDVKTINIKIFSSLGRMILDKTYSNICDEMEIQLNPVSGIYYLKCELDNGDTFIRKLIVL